MDSEPCEQTGQLKRIFGIARTLFLLKKFMDGQLGHDRDNSSVPYLVSTWDEHKDSKENVGFECDQCIGSMEGQVDKPSKVIAVEAGGMMSCAIDQDGVLWMWGRCPFLACKGTEGSFSLSICERPQPVVGLLGFQVLKVACGNEHVLSIIDKGCLGKEGTGQVVCYAWGNNTYGQLGLGDNDSRLIPEHVQAFNKQLTGIVADIACGAFHSAVLTHSECWKAETSDLSKSDADLCSQDRAAESKIRCALLKRKSLCWTFGLGANGQLGHGNSQSIASPKMVENLPEDEKITVVSCGLFHMGVLTETGGVWTWGMERGLGLCPGSAASGIEAGDFLLPARVSGDQVFTSSHGTKLTCGAAHTILAANDGSGLWAWGRGQNGVLGTGHLVDSLAPSAVVWPPHDGGGAGRTEIDSGMFQAKSAEKFNDEAFNSDAFKLEKMLALAQREICTLTTELTAVKHHAAILHAALYGVPASSHLNQAQEILQEVEQKIEESSYDNLVWLNEFYRRMRSRVKDVCLKRKMENLCRHYIEALKDQGQQSAAHIMH